MARSSKAYMWGTHMSGGRIAKQADLKYVQEKESKAMSAIFQLRLAK
ncbi:hypothetical protein HDG34_004411 [Paraburkholderia sp. HC6.4b]|nr:hypothetical protein [Paraburkholderia sp. HC6.4b]MBB5452742.1 hypothetical protein [Paraburkholderia sp. Kb1A]MBB5496486.1 hypothetical protein [Paraburkholderia sp. MM5384-R2]